MTDIKDLSQAPQGDVAQNPWRAPLRCITWGLLLPCMDIHLPWLNALSWINHLLPAFGSALLFWGCYTLRGRHEGFRRASQMALALLVSNLIVSLTAANDISLQTILGLRVAEIGATETLLLCTYLVSIVANILLLLGLRRGVKAEFTRSGAAHKPDVFLWLLLYPLLSVLAVLAVLAMFTVVFLGGLIIIVPICLLCLIVWIFASMFQLADRLGETAPDLAETLAESKAPSPKMQITTAAGFALLTMALILSVVYLPQRAPTDAIAYTNEAAPAQAQNLIDLGLFPEIAADLSPEALAKLQNAVYLEQEERPYYNEAQQNHYDLIWIEVPNTQEGQNDLYALAYWYWGWRWGGVASPRQETRVTFQSDFLIPLEDSWLTYEKGGQRYRAPMPHVDHEGLYLEDTDSFAVSFSFPGNTRQQGAYILCQVLYGHSRDYWQKEIAVKNNEGAYYMPPPMGSTVMLSNDAVYDHNLPRNPCSPRDVFFLDELYEQVMYYDQLEHERNTELSDDLQDRRAYMPIAWLEYWDPYSEPSQE